MVASQCFAGFNPLEDVLERLRCTEASAANAVFCGLCSVSWLTARPQAGSLALSQTERVGGCLATIQCLTARWELHFGQLDNLGVCRYADELDDHCQPYHSVSRLGRPG
jgi:hypothetical protein